MGPKRHGGGDGVGKGWVLFLFRWEERENTAKRTFAESECEPCRYLGD